MDNEIVFQCVYGSRLYGTNNQSSDTDFKQIHILPTDVLLTGKYHGCFNKSTNNVGRNSASDVDFDSKELRTFIKEALSGVTYALEMLFVPKDCITVNSVLWNDIVIETLKPKNMSKNHNMAQSILDSSFGKIKDTLKYKCSWNGIHLVFAPAFYASSKYCSCCGHKKTDLKLSDREWTCSNCGEHLDRDVNAAKNLQYYALWLMDKHIGESQSTVSSTGSYACVDERLQFCEEQCSSVKQEFKTMYFA
jgi:IS605 OrfB family transposase